MTTSIAFEPQSLTTAISSAPVIDTAHLSAAQLQALRETAIAFFQHRFLHSAADYENWSRSAGRTLNSRESMSKWYPLGDVTQAVLGDRSGDTESSDDLFPKMFAASLDANNGANRPIGIDIAAAPPAIVIQTLSASTPSYPNAPSPLAENDDGILSGRRWFEPHESVQSLIAAGHSFPGATIAMKIHLADGSTCTVELLAFLHPVTQNWVVDYLGFQKCDLDRLTALDY